MSHWVSWEVLLSATVIAFALGHWFGARQTERYWVDHANSKFRTAVHHRGEFYYVVPESEYVALRDVKNAQSETSGGT